MPCVALLAGFLRVWRARFVLSSNESQAGLRISSLQLADEGLYRCEITYLEINEGCPVVQYVNLTVLGMYLMYFFTGLDGDAAIIHLGRLVRLFSPPVLSSPCSILFYLFVYLGARRTDSIVAGIYRLCCALPPVSYTLHRLFPLGSVLPPIPSRPPCLKRTYVYSLRTLEEEQLHQSAQASSIVRQGKRIIKKCQSSFWKAAALQRLINNRLNAASSYRL